MAGTQAADGLVETIEFIYDGTPIGTFDIVTNVSETPKYTTRTRKALGRRGVTHTQDAEGWDLSYTIADKDGALDKMLTGYMAAVFARIAKRLTAIRSTFYPATQRTTVHTYVDGVIDSAPRSAQRGEDSTFNIALSFGTNRTTEDL